MLQALLELAFKGVEGRGGEWRKKGEKEGNGEGRGVAEGGEGGHTVAVAVSLASNRCLRKVHFSAQVHNTLSISSVICAI